MTQDCMAGPPMDGLETKFVAFDQVATVAEDGRIEGYASIFGASDQGGDVVAEGAFRRSLEGLKTAGRSVKLLWQHDPAEPIGVWDVVNEDGKGLRVSGRLLTEVRRGAEALALLRAGAVDGLSIGYRTVRAAARSEGGRMLQDVELWEVSLVTFPMLPEARASAAAESSKSDDDEAELAGVLADALNDARGRIRG